MSDDAAPRATPDPSIEHCVAKVIELIQGDRSDRRAILQLGYNLGRLSELTGLGREPFWDRWKEAVGAWDRDELQRLAQRLREDRVSWPR